MRIFIVRHGESYSNVQGKIMSATDLPLTEKGIKQAEAARAYMEKETLNFQYVFSSPLIRARQTAEIINKNRAKISLRDDLREIELGKLEGLDWEEKMVRYPDVCLAGNLSKARPPGDESLEDVIVRCRPFIQDLPKGKAEDDNILIVSHGVTIRVLINCILGKPDHFADYINWADNTGVSEIGWCIDSGVKSLVRLNDRSHLTDLSLGSDGYETWGIFSDFEYIAVK